MMISPYSYIEEKKEWDLQKLYREKEKLEKFIKDYKLSGEYLDENVIVYPSPEVVISMYEDYIRELNILIANKENQSNNDKKYIEINDFYKIQEVIEENCFFDDAYIYKILYKDKKVEIEIIYDEIEYHFIMEDVIDALLFYHPEETEIYNIEIDKDKEYVTLDINDSNIYFKAKNIKLKTIDIENTIYTYASIKYNENQEKSFYYLTNINDLNIGDYVWIPVRDTFSPGIVVNIEKFTLNKVPYPISKIKSIVKKISKEDYDSFYENKEPKYSYDTSNDLYDDDFEFEDRETLLERAKQLPYLKSQKVEWKGMEKLDNGAYTMPFPIYSDEVDNWIKMFYELKLSDYNYIENFNYIKDKKIEELSPFEILSYYTHIIRAERFGDGIIASYLENDKLEKLQQRFKTRYLEFEEITDKNINNITQDNIFFLTLAEGGAMGEPCSIEIVCKNNDEIKLFHTNYSDFDIKKLYSKFPTLETLKCGAFGIVTGVNNEYIHVDLGMGNHLFVKEQIYNKFQNYIKDIKENCILYSNWLRIGLNILDYDWSK